MRYPATEKLEIIRLVEQSHLSVRQTLEKLFADTNHERHHELVEWWGSSDYDPGEVDARKLGKNVEALAAKWKRRTRKKD